VAKTPTDLYWAKKLRATPSLATANAKLTMTVAALEREIRKAHRHGIKEGFRQGHDAGKFAKITKEDLSAVSSFFDQFTQEKP
jgi:flagellar biosynthesis/type III secretory pathway protein FliH